MNRITEDGTRFAFILTTICHDPAVVDVVIGRVMAHHSKQEFGYVFVSALSVMTRHPLADAVAAIKAATGRDIQQEAQGQLDAQSR
ncbi:hypothetical protein SAMN04515671_1094 [Nakamurella panacisegetis]|uniref:Uncharacterized protein n=2 Tax=Nakamurella panacisegetis TaxID=1090615 RepID=A0A1H0JYE4_9ACTN|nr:hypothetical protein SAMN04515671_1094 [Nakamurella panacisegetis]